jgi:hypothetical protein
MAQGVEPRPLHAVPDAAAEARRARGQREMLIAGVTMLAGAAGIVQALKFRDPGWMLVAGAAALSWALALFLVGLARWLRG